MAAALQKKKALGGCSRARNSAGVLGTQAVKSFPSSAPGFYQLTKRLNVARGCKRKGLDGRSLPADRFPSLVGNTQEDSRRLLGILFSRLSLYPLAGAVE